MGWATLGIQFTCSSFRLYILTRTARYVVVVSFLVKRHGAWFDLHFADWTATDEFVWIGLAMTLMIVHCSSVSVLIWTELAFVLAFVGSSAFFDSLRRLLDARSALLRSRRWWQLGFNWSVRDFNFEHSNSCDLKSLSCQKECVEFHELDFHASSVNEWNDLAKIANVDVIQLDFPVVAAWQEIFLKGFD